MHTRVVVCGTTVKESERNKKLRPGVGRGGWRGEGEVSEVGPRADGGPRLCFWERGCVAGSPGLAAALPVDPCWCPPPQAPEPPFTGGYTWLASLNRGRWGRRPRREHSRLAEGSAGRWAGAVSSQCPLPWGAPPHILGSPCAHPKLLFVRDSAAGAWEGGSQRSARAG